MDNPLVILGCGYIGSRLARAALAAGRKVRVGARGKARLAPLGELGAEVIYLDAAKPKQFGPALSGLSGATVVYSIPPVTELPAGEAVRRACNAALSAARCFIYLGSSAVYGAAPDDEWIDEDRTFALDDTNMVGYRSDELAVQAGTAAGLHTVIFRLAAVYGPGRGVRARMRRGEYQVIDEGRHYVSRVHVDDVVQAIFAAEERAPAGALYLVGDDKPTPQIELPTYLAGRLGLAPPKSIPLYEPGKPRHTHRGRRLRNDHMKQELGLTLRYPTYVEGEAAIDQEEAE
jgi:nucleoside-diphosphate-sugar epimerase